MKKQILILGTLALSLFCFSAVQAMKHNKVSILLENGSRYRNAAYALHRVGINNLNTVKAVLAQGITPEFYKESCVRFKYKNGEYLVIDSNHKPRKQRIISFNLKNQPIILWYLKQHIQILNIPQAIPYGDILKIADDQIPIILNDGHNFRNAAYALYNGGIKNLNIVKAALALGVTPEFVNESGIHLKYKNGQYLAIDSMDGSNEQDTIGFCLSKQPIIREYLKHYLQILNIAQTNPSRDMLKIAIEEDYAYIVEVLYNAGVPLFFEDLKLAKIAKAQLVGKFLVKLPYFQTIGKIRQVSKNGINLPEEVMNYIATMAN